MARRRISQQNKNSLRNERTTECLMTGSEEEGQWKQRTDVLISTADLIRQTAL